MKEGIESEANKQVEGQMVGQINDRMNGQAEALIKLKEIKQKGNNTRGNSF